MPRTYSQLYYHLVFATKLRLPWLKSEVCQDLYPFLGGAIREQKGSLISIGGMPDHLHLLVRLKPVTSLARIMKSIKGSSSHWLNDTCKVRDQFAWQEGYAAFTVSTSALESVAAYIENQEHHHRDMPLRAEMIQLFNKHKIDFREDELEF